MHARFWDSAGSNGIHLILLLISSTCVQKCSGLTDPRPDRLRSSQAGLVVWKDHNAERGPVQLATTTQLLVLSMQSCAQKCLDRTDPVPWPEIQQRIEQELGKPISTVFSRIDPVPLATASVAQVHTVRKPSLKISILNVLCCCWGSASHLFGSVLVLVEDRIIRSRGRGLTGMMVGVLSNLQQGKDRHQAAQASATAG